MSGKVAKWIVTLSEFDYITCRKSLLREGLFLTFW